MNVEIECNHHHNRYDSLKFCTDGGVFLIEI